MQHPADRVRLRAMLARNGVGRGHRPRSRRTERCVTRCAAGSTNFVEIHVATSLEDCEARDVEGCTPRPGRRDPEFTGVSTRTSRSRARGPRRDRATATPAAVDGEVVSWLEASDLVR